MRKLPDVESDERCQFRHTEPRTVACWIKPYFRRKERDIYLSLRAESRGTLGESYIHDSFTIAQHQIWPWFEYSNNFYLERNRAERRWPVLSRSMNLPLYTILAFRFLTKFVFDRNDILSHIC